MTARTPVEFVDENGQRVGNLVEISGIDPASPLAVELVDLEGDALGQKAMAASLPVVIASDQSNIPANIGRDNEPLTLTYVAAVDPTTFIDKRRYAMVAVGPIPAACNGLTMTPLTASDAAGAGKVIPYFTDSVGTKTAFYGVAVATGEWWVIQAEIAPLPFFGLRFSGGGVTTTIPVYLMG